MTSDFEGFSILDFIHYVYCPILILEKEPVFSLLNVQLNKALLIELGTSRTRSQHYTTRLSRRRFETL